MTRTRVHRAAGLLLGAAILSACSDSAGPSSAGDERVSLSFTTRATTTVQGTVAASARQPGGFYVAAHAGGRLVIDRAELVLDEIELESTVSATSCSGSSGALARRGSDDSGSDDSGRDRCRGAKVETGPMLVNLPLGAGVVTPLHAAVPAGSYREMELEIEVLDDDSGPEAAFLASHPGFRGISVRVTGTYDGQPFTYTAPLMAELEMDFDTPLVVDASGLNVTVQVDLDRWFRDASGAVIDPRTANDGQPNALLVESNIRSSFVAFRDDDRNGRRGR